MRRALLVLLPLVALPSGLGAQAPLTLAAALARAERAGYANRIAQGTSAEQAGAALAAYRGILPSVRLEGSYLRTTDPLAAFGMLLRQRAVTPAAFAPDRLNDPAAIGNLSTGLVVEQPVFNADAWLGRRAAVLASRASGAAERWVRAGTAVEITRGYWGAVLIGEQVTALTAALEAARAHVRQAEALSQQGMVTRADVLLASVKAGEVEALRLGAESEQRMAHLGLALLMGDPADTLFTLPPTLPPADTLRDAAGAPVGGPGVRADVAAAELAERAARTDVRRAQVAYLPRLNGFGRLDWNTPRSAFGGQSAWTVGLMVSWSPFAGGSELAEMRAARGRRDVARAQAEAARAQGALEERQSADRVQLAAARMDITERGVAQAAEAHRIVERKYEGGLATVSELLDAASVETSTRLGALAARYEVLVATAEWQKARGQSTSTRPDPES